MRSNAASVEEICERHGCVARVPNGVPLPSVAPYEDIAVVGDVDGTVLPSLTQAIHAIRPGWEVVEIYVRPTGGSEFQPLQIDPVGLRDPIREEPVSWLRWGLWTIVARRRHPTYGPRIVGIMMAKDEADVIPDVVGSLARSLDNLFFCAQDEATKAAVLASNSVNGWARSVDPPTAVCTDGHRQALLDRARADGQAADDRRPAWIMVVQGDEIYEDDLRRHALLADAERATVMSCQVATFLLHESQREGWDWTLPLEKRLTHYIWDFGEHAGFVDFPWLHYKADEHMRAHPRSIYPGAWARTRPVRKHYPFRTPEQARARIKDRLESGWQPHYEHYRNVFVGDVAAGRVVRPYLGWFPEVEKDA